MNTQEIISYVTNPTTTIQQKGEYLEWQLFDWLNVNGFTHQKQHTKIILIISKEMEA